MTEVDEHWMPLDIPEGFTPPDYVRVRVTYERDKDGTPIRGKHEIVEIVERKEE